MALLATGCGGGSAHGVAGTTSKAAVAAVMPGATLAAAADLAQQCAQPRPEGSSDPASGLPYSDTQGSLSLELAWIRSWINETYLWYAEVARVDPAPYLSGAVVPHVDPATNTETSVRPAGDHQVVDAYFNSQRTRALSASGKPKDRFHFTYLTNEWQALAQSGSVAGFGFEVALLAAAPPRKVLVSIVDPSSLAAANGIARGAEIISIDAVSVKNGSDVATLNEALFSPQIGKSYRFEVLDPGSSETRTLSMTAVQTSLVAVPDAKALPAPYQRVGYIAFHDHIATAEIGLLLAVQHLKNANGGTGIDDLVVDLRYNGGGFLDIAAELAYMIAGAEATRGKFFDRQNYNDKNPFQLTAEDATTPFPDKTLGFSGAVGQSLPQLSLPRVFVLTGSATCSASEALISGLRGIGLEVIQIGERTCGKPYGFFPTDNCGTTYFAIQFKGVNFQGYGDYVDGFSPGAATGAADTLPGCSVADDFAHALGDPAERRLAAALQFRATGTCPRAAAQAPPRQAGAAGQALSRPPLRDNRYDRPRSPRADRSRA